MSAEKPRKGRDVDSNAHIIYDYDHSLDDVHDGNGYLNPEYARDAQRWRKFASPLAWWQRWHWLVFTGAFVIPFGVLALILAAAGYLDGDGENSAGAVSSLGPTMTVEGYWPSGVTFAAHTIPAMIRDDIPYTGAQRGYQFEGRSGEVWRITVEPESGFDPQIRLYEPLGSELAYNDDLAAGNLIAEMVVILPADGTYRLLVEAAAKSNGVTGTYWLSVFEE